MRDVLETAAAWVRDGLPFAVATVVGTSGSAPRELGASMLIGADGRLVGNVSGGCVEGAVVAEADDVLATGQAVRRRYGISADEVFEAGLTCGGQIDVLVRAVLPGSEAARQVAVLAASDAPLGLGVTVFGAGLGDSVLVDEAGGFGLGAVLLHEDAAGCPTEVDPARSVLVTGFGQPPRLIVVGAVAFAAALARLGSALGLAVTVVDPRSAFASPERFAGAEVVVDWPDRYLSSTAIEASTAIAVLTHDAKVDVPALRVALASPAGYVGALGSRRTHDDRLERLRAAGATSAQLARLRSPIGLDLGGRSPEETALSILAEIVAVRHGATGVPLSERSGAIHADGGIRPVRAGVVRG